MKNVPFLNIWRYVAKKIGRTPKFWYKKKRPLWLLRVSAHIYAWCIRLYQRRMMRRCACIKMPCPMIVVGNAVAGGSGKTPSVAMISKILTRRGYCVIIASKGWGRQSSFQGFVCDDHRWQDVGDEPLMLYRQGYKVFVGKNRQFMLQELRAWMNDRHEDYIVVWDDGLHDPTLGQAHKILILHHQQNIGNGYLLPAGPLRMPFSHSLLLADEVLFHTSALFCYRACEDDAYLWWQKTRFPYHPSTPTVASYTLCGHRTWDYNKPPLLFCGLGFAEKFFHSFSCYGSSWMAHHKQKIRTLSFPDHHPYTFYDHKEFYALSKHYNMVTTAKDYVRLHRGLQKRVHVWTQSIESFWEKNTHFLRHHRQKHPMKDKKSCTIEGNDV